MGPLSGTGRQKKFLKKMNCWFEQWLISYMPKLLHQPKWFHSDRDLSVGDIVLFLKQDGDLNKSYQ